MREQEVILRAKEKVDCPLLLPCSVGIIDANGNGSHGILGTDDVSQHADVGKGGRILQRRNVQLYVAVQQCHIYQRWKAAPRFNKLLL